MQVALSKNAASLPFGKRRFIVMEAFYV